MKVTAFLTVAVLSISLSTPTFASEHMHVNHDHEHKRYQPANSDQGSTGQNTPAQAPNENQ